MNKQAILQYVTKKFHKKDTPPFRVGDTVRVHVRITEGDATRVQIFEGVVTSMKGQQGSRTFTARKISFGVGVERCFPLDSPTIDKLEVVRSGHARRAKLYYLRERIGRSARLEEKEAGAAADSKKPSSNKLISNPVPSPELAVAKEK